MKTSTKKGSMSWKISFRVSVLNKSEISNTKLTLKAVLVFDISLLTEHDELKLKRKKLLCKNQKNFLRVVVRLGLLVDTLEIF